MVESLKRQNIVINLDRRSEKASNMRKRIYNLKVVKKNITIESMQKDAPNQMGVFESLHQWKKSRMHNEGKYVKL